MEIGVAFPQTEIGNNPSDIRAFAEATERMVYTHIVAIDHVIGADGTIHTDLTGPYRYTDPFHEIFVLMGYLAAVTARVELVTGVLILPQRQTALVAKQAAEIDILSEGRLRLGVGIGWNHVEYEVLGENFKVRGARMEEQIEVMRQLWTQEIVNFSGRWHTIEGAGINPLPVNRPIPIWFGGGSSDIILRRIARLGDGWFPLGLPDHANERAVSRLKTMVTEEGRDPDVMGIQAIVRVNSGIEEAVRQALEWKDIGATHVRVNTMGANFRNVNEHINALKAFEEAFTG
jgi:probable F420-dependent oxidoreductase